MPGPITSGFLWSRWRGKRSRHSRCINNPKLYVSGKKPIGFWQCIVGSYDRWEHYSKGHWHFQVTCHQGCARRLWKNPRVRGVNLRASGVTQRITVALGWGLLCQVSTFSNFPLFDYHYLFIPTLIIEPRVHIDGLTQDCSNSIANAMELLQSCTKPSIFDWCRRSLDRVTPVKYECDSRYMCPQGQDMGVIENFRCGKNKKRGFSKLHPKVSRVLSLCSYSWFSNLTHTPKHRIFPITIVVAILFLRVPHVLTIVA